MNDIFDTLSVRAAEALAKEGFAESEHQFVRTADLRYFGQAFEVRVPVSEGPIDVALLDAVARRFHAEHRVLYGYDFGGDPTQPVEWVNLRVSGIGPIQRPEIKKVGRVRASSTGGGVSTSSTDGTETSRRPVCFEAADGYIDTPVFWRDDLVPGTVVTGPAVIEEFGSTVPLHRASSRGSTTTSTSS